MGIDYVEGIWNVIWMNENNILSFLFFFFFADIDFDIEIGVG